MNAFDLLRIIGQAQDAYILDAETARQEAPKPKNANHWKRTLAAVLAIVLAGFLFLQTPMGAAAAELVKEHVSKLIETLFPPKEILVTPEGLPESVIHEAMGEDPDPATPGFSIYVDTESYAMTEENGAWFIRPLPVPIDRDEIRQGQQELLKDLSPEEQEAAIDQRVQELEAYYASHPPCELEIREISGKDPQTVAEETRAAMEGRWEYLSDILAYRDPRTLCIDASQGDGPQDAREKHDFLENGTGGTFHIISRTYTEAAEGHGSRLYQMRSTFTILAPQDASAYTGGRETLLEAMRQEVNNAQIRNDELLTQLQEVTTQADMNDIAQLRHDLWMDVNNKLWHALEQTEEVAVMEDLLAGLLEWAAHKASVLDGIKKELDGGSLTATAVYGESAAQLEARCHYLLNVMEGTAPIPAPYENPELDPKPLVEAFVKAYFSGDAQAISGLLPESYGYRMDTYQASDPGGVVLQPTTGLDNIPEDMARKGRLDVSVPFRPEADSDYFVYLSITLEWAQEAGRWQITFYGLEG